MKVIACDPGISGAICVKDGSSIEVYDIPTTKDKKGKKVFDVKAIANIISQHTDADICIIEDVHCLFGNGAVSMFNFGRGKGILEGIAFANNFRVVYTPPQTWKKHFVELAPPPRQKSGKDKPTVVLKDKQELARDKRIFKAAAKAKAREIAAKLYPQLADRFKTVNSDGRAEACLLATFAESHYTE